MVRSYLKYAALAFLIGFQTQPALADSMNSGWDFTLTCPDYDQTGNSGTLTVSNPNGFSCNGGCGQCQRLANSHFQSITFSGETLPSGASLNASTIYAVNVGKFLFVPPVINTDPNPIFSIASECNNFTAAVNFLFLQIDPASFAGIKTKYIWGQSTLSPASSTMTSNYDIDGTQTFSGSYSLPIASCSGGVYSVTGSSSSDFNAMMYTGNDWSGLYKTGPGQATIFVPANTVTQSALGNLTSDGIFFNSGTPGSVVNVQVSSNAAGSVFTVTPYTNVSTNTLSGVTSDTITISAVNSPFAGAMKGTVKRNGSGSGRIDCLANQGGGSDGQIVACAGEDPLDNAKPYAVVFDYKPTPGTLDTLFGGSGTVVGSAVASSGAGVLDSSGRLVVVGNNSDFFVARYSTDGTLDTTFNGTGTVDVQVSPYSSPSSNAGAVAIDPFGKIIVAGSATMASGHTGAALARFNSDGTLDTTFNSSGSLPGTVIAQLSTYGFNPGSSVSTIAIDGSGKYVVAGSGNDATTGLQAFAVARFNTDGTLDTTFNSTGAAITEMATGGGTSSGVSGLAVDGSGKVVVVGNAMDGSGFINYAIARYNSNGTLDTTFNTTGKIVIQVSSYAPNPYSSAGGVAIDSSNKVIVAGLEAYNSGSSYAVGLLRYNTNGTLDTTFNSTGILRSQISTATTPSSYAHSVAIDSSGKIVVGGVSSDASNNSGFGVARYNTDGSLDTILSPAIPFSGYMMGDQTTMIIDRSGKIIIAGYVTPDTVDYNLALARISP